MALDPQPDGRRPGAIFAYLRSLAPIHNPATDPKIDDELIWKLRDSFDRLRLELPHEDWAAAKPR